MGQRQVTRADIGDLALGAQPRDPSGGSVRPGNTGRGTTDPSTERSAEASASTTRPPTGSTASSALAA